MAVPIPDVPGICVGCGKATQCGHSTGKETPLKVRAGSGRPGAADSDAADGALQASSGASPESSAATVS